MVNTNTLFENEKVLLEAISLQLTQLKARSEEAVKVVKDTQKPNFTARRDMRQQTCELSNLFKELRATQIENEKAYKLGSK